MGSLRRIVGSFGPASRGAWEVLRSQTNAWVHLVASVVVVVLGVIARVDANEWCLLVLAMGLVWGMEAANTALEKLADAVHPERHRLVGQAKDAAAGGVLLAAVAAAMVGIVILGPKLWGMIVSSA